MKSSSLSSGARAAAQTLNVPLEQLEANIQQQHQHTNGNVTMTNNLNNGNLNHNERSHQTNGNVSHHHQQQQHQQHHHLEERHHLNMIERNEAESPYNGYPPQYVHRKNSSGNLESSMNNSYQEDYNHLPPAQGVAKHSLLHFAMQHFRNE